MQMTTEARAWLDATVRRILARHPLGDAERAGITYELMSHLHAAGEARAKAAGRTEVAREDLEAALVTSGGEPGLAEAFVQPLAKPVERVLFGRRAGALAIDMVIVLVGVALIHGAIEYALVQHLGIAVNPEADHMPGWMHFLPWAFHDASLAPPIQGVFVLTTGAWVLGYFVWTEGRDGRTLGKRALDLRVMRADGLPVTYRDAFARNVVKLVPPLFLLDTVIMLLAFANEKQRVSDRIAGTIVVKG